MGRFLQVQIVNYLSILSLENLFMHTIKVFVLQNITVFFFFVFFLNLKM